MNQNPALAALWGGYQSDEDKSLQATDGGALKFGLNPNCTIEVFEYSTKTGQNNTEGNPAICITIDINGRKTNTRIYAPGNKVYWRGKEVKDQNSEDYINGLKQQIATTKGLVTHYLKGLGITEAVIQQNLGAVNSFEQLANLACSAAQQFMKTAKVDVFCHYQATVRDGSDKTFLEIPTDLTYGSFITPSTPGAEWSQTDTFTATDEEGNVITKSGLAWKNQQGVQHRFVRDDFFLKSKRASEQTKSGGASAASGSGNGGAQSPFAAPATAQNTQPTQGNATSWG